MMNLTIMSIDLLKKYLNDLHQKYINSEYIVKVRMLSNSTKNNNIDTNESLADLENEINRVSDEIEKRIK